MEQYSNTSLAQPAIHPFAETATLLQSPQTPNYFIIISPGPSGSTSQRRGHNTELGLAAMKAGSTQLGSAGLGVCWIGLSQLGPRTLVAPVRRNGGGSSTTVTHRGV
jgi:hypothetical protein